MPRILISGAGIAGISLAILLEEAGIEYVLIEKQKELPSSTSGIALPFNAVNALKNFSCFIEIMNHAYEVGSVTYSKASGIQLATASLDEEAFSGGKFIALRRAALLETLASTLKNDISFSTTIQSFNDQRSKVEVSLTNSSVSQEFDLIVSAEGVHSSLRQQCFSNDDTIVDHNITNWRFITESKSHGFQPLYMFGRSDLFMVYPLSDDELYCYGHIYDPSGRYSAEHSALENVKRLFGNYGRGVGDLVNGISQKNVITGRLKSVKKPYMSKGKVVFVGDAANACSPLLQQGAAGAFEDVLCLVDELKKGSVDQAIEAYHKQREPKNRWVLDASDGPISKVKASQTWIGSAIRNAMIRKLGPLNVHGWKQLASENNVSL